MSGLVKFLPCFTRSMVDSAMQMPVIQLYYPSNSFRASRLTNLKALGKRVSM